MPVQIVRKVRDRQPRNKVEINFDNVLCDGLESIFLGSLSKLYVKNKWAVGGSTVSHVASAGIGILCDTSNYRYYNLSNSNAGTGNWTIAGILVPTASFSDNMCPVGVTDWIGGSPNDRCISINSGKWSAYIYDGAPKYAVSNRTPVSGVPDIVVITSNGSSITCSVKGYPPVTVATSNNGYTGYSAAKFVLGDASSNAGSIPVSIPLMIRVNVAWNGSQVKSFLENPWQIFKPETIPLFWSGVTAQFARPVSDISNTGWTPSSGSDLFAMIGETVRNDATYISATEAGAACEVLLGTSTGDPLSSINHLPRIVMSAGSGGIIIRLKQGATLIKEWTYSSLTGTDTLYEPTLTGGEIDSITDYTDLRLYLETTA